jgi:hypothetical protein
MKEGLAVVLIVLYNTRRLLIGSVNTDVYLTEGCLLVLHEADGTTSHADGFVV